VYQALTSTLQVLKVSYRVTPIHSAVEIKYSLVAPKKPMHNIKQAKDNNV